MAQEFVSEDQSILSSIVYLVGGKPDEIYFLVCRPCKVNQISISWKTIISIFALICGRIFFRGSSCHVIGALCKLTERYIISKSSITNASI